MEGNFFSVGRFGKTPQDAFNSAVDEAFDVIGTDPYNGSISTCVLGSCVGYIDNYDKETDEKIVDLFLEKVEVGECDESVRSEMGIAKYVELRYSDGSKMFLFYGLGLTDW